MAKQILLLVAVSIGLAAKAKLHEPGSVLVVDDAIADDLLGMDPPAAKLDTSELPKAPRGRRGGQAPSSPPDGGADAGAGEGGEPSGSDEGAAASGDTTAG